MSAVGGVALAVLVVAAFVFGVQIAAAVLPPLGFGSFITVVTAVAALLAGGLLAWHPWRNRIVTGVLGVVLGVAIYFLLWSLLLVYVPRLGLLNITVLVAAVMVAPVFVVELRRRQR